MFKLMKYEIQGTYKTILGILALVYIFITGIYFFISDIESITNFGAAFLGLSYLVLFGTALTTVLYIVNSFKKELYEDRGYLTFTLPLTGNQIIGAKLIVALWWFFFLGLAIVLYNLLMVFIFSMAELHFSDLAEGMRQIITVKEFVIGMIYLLIKGISLILLIYFSMALSRVTIKNKRIGGLWFIIFLVLSGFLTFGQVHITEWFPYYFDLQSFRVGTLEQFHDFNVHVGLMDAGTSFFIQETALMNIASTIYQLLVIVALYLGTSYLIERKIDL